MFNSRYPQRSLRELLAETVMCRRTFEAHSAMASGIDKVLSGFVMRSGDPGGGSSM